MAGLSPPEELTPAARQLIATFFARPGGPRVLRLMEDHGLASQDIREITADVRLNVWKDFSHQKD